MDNFYKLTIFYIGLLALPSGLLCQEVEGGETSGESVSEWIDYNDSYQNPMLDEEAVASEVTGGILIEDIIEPATGYSYAVFNKRDPFIPPFLRSRSLNSEETPIINILQNYDLSELKVAGIWRSYSGESKVLVMTKNNEGVIVKREDPIGKNNGKIIAIGTDSITVREYSYTLEGTQQFEDIDLPLQPSKVEGGTFNAENQALINQQLIDQIMKTRTNGQGSSSAPVATNAAQQGGPMVPAAGSSGGFEYNSFAPKTDQKSNQVPVDSSYGSPDAPKNGEPAFGELQR